MRGTREIADRQPCAHDISVNPPPTGETAAIRPVDPPATGIDWFGPGTLDDLKNWHYLHVSQDVLPYLREHGVPESDIDQMLTANPARILAG